MCGAVLKVNLHREYKFGKVKVGSMGKRKKGGRSSNKAAKIPATHPLALGGGPPN